MTKKKNIILILAIILVIGISAGICFFTNLKHNNFAHKIECIIKQKHCFKLQEKGANIICPSC